MIKRVLILTAWALIFTIGLVMSSTAQTGNMVSGTVFNDLNNNGVLDDKLNIVNGTYSTKDYWTGPTHFPYLAADAACGSWWSKAKDERGIPLSVAQDGTPNGFFVFQFDDNTYSLKFHPANHPPDALDHRVMTDPPVLDFYTAYKDIDPGLKARESSHMWTADLPTDLEKGSHLLKITTTDRFNNTFFSCQIFEIK